MEIKEIELADISLVALSAKNCIGDVRVTPHCKNHGAMNKYTKDGIWRCSAYGIRNMKYAHTSDEIKARKEPRIKIIDNACRAGCQFIEGRDKG